MNRGKYKVLYYDESELGEDDPCFVIRGKDALVLPVLQDYIDRANAMNLPTSLVRDLIQLSADIKYWQDKNRDKIKLAD